jgi:3-oxoacyl-[acyl-carrier-protein] synthase-3
MNDVFIKSLGYYIPKGRLTNDDMLKKFEADNAETLAEDRLRVLSRAYKRKFEFLGCKTRSYCIEEEDNYVDMTVKASMSAIEKANLKPEQIDCFIFSGIGNPFREPTFAMVAAQRLGVNSGDFFDINDTCNGFMKSLEIASLYITSGKYKNVLVITCESPFEFLNGYKSNLKLENEEDANRRFTTMFLGAGAAAMVLSNTGDGRIIKHQAEKKETENWDTSWLTLPNVYTPENRYGRSVTGFWTDARGIASAVTKEQPKFVKDTLNEWDMTLDNIDYIFMHQLGNNITFSTLSQLDVPREKAPVNTFNDFGNMAGANIPICLAIAEEQGILKSGQSILLMGSGAGITYSVAHIIW